MIRSPQEKGNVAAAVLVIMLLLLALGVFLYQPFVEPEQSVDYGEVFSEVRTDVERGVFEEVQTSFRSGLGAVGGTGTLFWNQAYEINESEVEQNLEENVGNNEVVIEYENGEATVPIDGENVQVNLVEEGLQIKIANETITAELDGETREVELEDEYTVRSDLQYKINRINDWLSCDMGNVTGKFLELHQSKDCQFENCCCTTHNLTTADVKQAVEAEGISEENISNILRKSVSILNNMLANETLSCQGAISQIENNNTQTMDGYECSYDQERSNILVQNDYVDLEFFDYSDTEKICNNPTDNCALEPIESESGELKDIEDPQIVYNDTAVKGIVGINNTGVDSEYMSNDTVQLPKQADEEITEYINENNGQLPQGDDEQGTMWFASGSEKRAEGDVTIQCRNPDVNAEDPEELRFKLKFKNRYQCENDLENRDTLEEGDEEFDEQTDDSLNPLACKGSPGGSAGTIACEDQLEGESCPNIDPDDYQDLAGNPDVYDGTVEIIEAMEGEWDDSCVPYELTCADVSDDKKCTLPFLVDENNNIQEELADPEKSMEWEFPDQGKKCDICGTCTSDGQCGSPAAEGIVCQDSELEELRGEPIDSGEAGQWQCNGQATDESACEFQVVGCQDYPCEGSVVDLRPDENRAECSYNTSESCDTTWNGCTVPGLCTEGGGCEVDTSALDGDNACCQAADETYDTDTEFCCEEPATVLEDTQENRDACEEAPT